jgi:flagellar biosynthesis protein FlhB
MRKFPTSDLLGCGGGCHRLIAAVVDAAVTITNHKKHMRTNKNESKDESLYILWDCG